MTNVAATYIYRREVAAAFRLYRDRLRQVHKVYGEPIPLSPQCAVMFIDAWNSLCDSIKVAGLHLEWNRWNT